MPQDYKLFDTIVSSNIYRKSIQLRNFKLLRGEGQLSRLSCMKVTLLLIQRYKLMGKSKI
jgi:hypothetical protein